MSVASLPAQSSLSAVVFSATALPALAKAADVVMTTVQRGDLFVFDEDGDSDFDPSAFEADLVVAYDALAAAAESALDNGKDVWVSTPLSAWSAAVEILEADRLSQWAPMKALLVDVETALG